MSEGTAPEEQSVPTSAEEAAAEQVAGEEAAAEGVAANEKPSTPGRPQTLETFASVEHVTRGRTRLRLRRELRTPEAMATIQNQLMGHEDVTDVAINQRTGSVVITHAKHRLGGEIFTEAVKEVELVGGALLDLPEDEEEEEGGGGDRFAKLDQQLADVVYKVDYAVWKKTGLHFRGQILAGSIAGLGVAQILIFGISLEMLPGPLLIYLAWDIYHRETKEIPFERRFADEQAANGADDAADEADDIAADEAAATAAA